MIPGHRQFGFGARLIRTGPKLVLHQRADVVREHLQPSDIGADRANGFVCRQHGQVGVRSSRRHIELGQGRLILRERGLRACDVDTGLPEAEVDGFPRQQHARRAAPDAVGEGTCAKHWPCHRKDGGLWHEHPEDVIGCCAVFLPDQVQARQERRPRHTDPFVRRLCTRATLFDRRIVLERELNRIIQRERTGRLGLRNGVRWRHERTQDG